MKQYARILIAVVSFTLSFSSPLNACTDFRLMAKDGTVLISRSMEFAVDFKSNIRSSNRGRAFASSTINGKPTMSWKAKYGYIYADGLQQDVVIDGMNEMGLSFEALYLPGLTQYQTVPEGRESLAIPYYQLGAWVLSNFKNVDEVKAMLATAYVYTQAIPGLSNTVQFPLHFSIYDVTGKGIVVEYINGNMTITPNDIGTLTNSPSYDWQITNLRNFVNLSPYNPTPVTDHGLVFTATGQGSGMSGLPGDVAPPSRFVKIATLVRTAYPPLDAGSALNLAQHIINNVDIPLGITRAATTDGKDSAESTQWVVFKDLTHRVFYYRSYNDMTLRSIPFSKLTLTEGAPILIMPIVQPPYVIDMSGTFSNSKFN